MCSFSTREGRNNRFSYPLQIETADISTHQSSTFPYMPIVIIILSKVL